MSAIQLHPKTFAANPTVTKHGLHVLAAQLMLLSSQGRAMPGSQRTTSYVTVPLTANDALVIDQLF